MILVNKGIEKNCRGGAAGQACGGWLCMHASFGVKVYSFHPSVPSLYTYFINCKLLKENDAVIMK